MTTETAPRKPLKWLIWSSFFPPHVGGYEKNVFELARRLKAAGDKVAVITCKVGDSPEHENLDGVRVYRLPCWRLLNGTYPVPRPSLLLLKAFLQLEPDIESTQTRFFPLSFLGAAHAWMHRKPLIHTERGTQHSAVTNPVVNALSKAYDHTIGTWVVRRAKMAVGVSNAAVGFLDHIGARNAERIPNGITFVELPKRELREHKTDIPMVLFVGRLIWAKGVQDLIKAQQLADKDFRLVIAGDGPYREELKRLAGDNVVFLGQVTGEALWDLYSMASVFVNPSYSEGLPTSVMEAAMMGIPVVATDVGGTGEIAPGNMWLVSPHNAVEIKNRIEWILEDKGRAFRMALIAQTEVRRSYDWDKIVTRYRELAEEVCEAVQDEVCGVAHVD